MKHLKLYESSNMNNIFNKAKDRLKKMDNIDKKLLYTIYLNNDGSVKVLNSETKQMDFEFDNIEQLREELKNIDMLIHTKKYNI